jgi:hypothetical protein
MACRLRNPAGAAAALALFAATTPACEEDPPPPQQGAFSIQLTDNGVDCPVMSHKEELGKVGATGKPELVTDGSSNATVDCTIKKSGAGFSVSADLDAAGRVILNVDGLSDAATSDAPVQGQVTFASNGTGGLPYASPQSSLCNFWVDAAQGQYVKTGTAWFSFECPAVTQAEYTCELSESYIALKNCAGATEEEEEEAE